MIRVPLRKRSLHSNKFIYGNRAGRFFLANEDFDERVTKSEYSIEDNQFLVDNGHAFIRETSLEYISHIHQVAARDTNLSELDYLVLVPTLRCNLDCSYCQVSRAKETAHGFDWDEKTLTAILKFIDGLKTTSIKVEFQGGEPLLRPDLLKAVIERCSRFEEKQFVICTNLSKLEPEFLDIVDRTDVSISTSLDGPNKVHKHNRTHTNAETSMFYDNLDFLKAKYGTSKVSALPTIDPNNPPDINELIDAYTSFGFNSIYLRQINYMGFARKKYPDSKFLSEKWNNYFVDFVNNIIERNWLNKPQVLEESYLSLCLRRIFRLGLDKHVDLRNPNPVGVDCVLIDYDGKIYPSDEARMLTRSGVIDLAIGDVWNGFDTNARHLLNSNSTNHGDPDCDNCVYQPYCGRDLIDDLSRYGRIDLPRHETAFCQKHTFIFDYCFELIYSNNPKVRYSLARWLGLAGDYLPEQASLS